MYDPEGSSGTISMEPSTIQSLKIFWKIPDYFSLPNIPELHDGYSVSSPSFLFENSTLCFQLYPNKVEGTEIQLDKLHGLIEYSLHLVCEVSLVPWNNKNCSDGTNHLWNSTDYFYLKRFPKRSELFADREKYAPDGALVIMCRFFPAMYKAEQRRIERIPCDFTEECEMRLSKGFGSLSSETSIVQFVKIIWKLPQLSSIPNTLNYSLNSPHFVFSDASWCFNLFLNGTSASDPIMKIVLKRLDTNTSMACHDLIVANGIVEYIMYEDELEYIPSRITFNRKVTSKEFDLKIERSEALQKCYSKDGELNMFFLIFCEKQTMTRESESRRKLSQDFKKLLLFGPNHDLTLKVKDKEFPVHRSILSSRSKVFESMLNLDMKEKNSGVVDIPDCDPLAMEQLLIYLYCGEVDDLNEDNMLPLYYAADKYDMKYLRDECCNFIMKSLSHRNICDVVQLAMDHNDRDLLECATEFFVSNMKKILTTPKWMSFLKENAVAANELLIKASENGLIRKRKRED